MSRKMAARSTTRKTRLARFWWRARESVAAMMMRNGAAARPARNPTP
jgi:hypothetical protein